MLVKKKNMQFQCNERNIIMGVYELNIKKKNSFLWYLTRAPQPDLKVKGKGFLVGSDI